MFSRSCGQLQGASALSISSPQCSFLQTHFCRGRSGILGTDVRRIHRPQSHRQIGRREEKQGISWTLASGRWSRICLIFSLSVIRNASMNKAVTPLIQAHYQRNRYRGIGQPYCSIRYCCQRSGRYPMRCNAYHPHTHEKNSPIWQRAQIRSQATMPMTYPACAPHHCQN